MLNLRLQQSEAESLEALLDLILTHENAAQAAFKDGAQRRDVLRVSKKLDWAKCKAA